MLHAIQDRFPALLGGVVLVCTMVLTTACDQQETLSDEQIRALEDRVYARWQTKIARDFEKTWEFSTPSYREVFPQKFYPFRFSYAIEWELTGIEVLDYHRDAAVASVAVRVMSKPTKFTSAASRAVGAVPVTFVEQWILIDGEWWYSARV
jgi:hypothetical protein